MERGIIQGEITDNWHDPCPHKSLIIVTNVWSTAGLQCSASCPASPAAVTGPAACEAVAVWPCPKLPGLAAVTQAGAFNCFLSGTQDGVWWKQPKWQQLFPAAPFVRIDYRPQWKPAAEIAEFAAGCTASAESCDFSSVRSEGRLGHLSQCLHISDSHQVVLWYTQASSHVETYPSRMESSEELLIPRFLWSKGGICHSCKLHWAALVGKQPFLYHKLHLLFLPRDLFLIPQFFAGFMGSFLMPPQLLPAPWYSCGCSLLLQGKLGRKQNVGHTTNKIPPWAK